VTAFRFAVYLAASLLVAMDAREYARAVMASRLGDPTPRLWGRLSLNPKVWFEPFGSGVLPGLILLLWATTSPFLPPPVAYAKPAPIDPNYFRNRTRDTVITSLAGAAANLAVAGAAAVLARAGLGGELGLMVRALLFTNLCVGVFHLIPLPGLDGARLVALALPPKAREVYRNADQYLALFVLIVLFLFAGPLTSIVYSLVGSLCRVLAGSGCFSV
jgi:Zn-dependent protease